MKIINIRLNKHYPYYRVPYLLQAKIEGNDVVFIDNIELSALNSFQYLEASHYSIEGMDQIIPIPISFENLIKILTRFIKLHAFL